MDERHITSSQNPKIKLIKRLEKNSVRREEGLFVLEGIRELCLAVRAGYELTQVFVCEEALTTVTDYDPMQAIVESGAELFHVSRAVYADVAYREGTEGVIALAKPKQHTLTQLVLKENPLLLVIEGVEKPGNLGAMLRTADAAGVDAVIICDAKTDLYNPNVIRSSIGTVFTNQIAVCESGAAIAFLQQKNIATYAAELTAKGFHHEQNFAQPTAIVVGTEASGLGREWMKAATTHIKIPMLGKIDSLNVSVSAAVLLYEAVRQRMNLNP